MGEWIVDVISFQKIFGFCSVRGHIVEIRRDVTLVDEQRTTNNGRNVKIELEFWEAEFAIPKNNKVLPPHPRAFMKVKKTKLTPSPHPSKAGLIVDGF